MTRRQSVVIFWLFCFVVFSKIGWYDLRVYAEPGDRREITTSLYAVWVVAQGFVYLPIVFQLLRQFRPAVWFFVLAVAPYLVLGLIDGRFNLFLVGDFARYGMSLGFFLFSLWAVKNIPLRTILTAVTCAIAFWIVARTAIHWIISGGSGMRYGRPWEVFLPAVLIAGAAFVKGRRYAFLLILLAVFVTAAMFGLSRGLMIGICLAAVFVVILAMIVRLPGKLRFITAGALTIVLALFPMITPPALFKRLDVAQAIEQTDTSFLSDDAYDNDTSNDLRAAREELEAAIAAGDASLNVRIAEGIFFLTLMKQSAQSFLLGAGAGDHVVIQTPRGPRILRGAHNTIVTLLYRHGAILGLGLCAFVGLFGLWGNFRLLAETPAMELQVLLTALIAYRLSADAMSLVSQGLFDDPLVFLSITLALSYPRTSHLT